MAEKHKSKYKKPENTKYTSRKDLKDYTEDDKTGGLNPKSAGEKQSNVLRKTDKEVVDTGDMYVKYNADDRLYKDLENGEYDTKHAAKVLKKRQDADEKANAKNVKDKIENLTREGKERLVREYVRRKINVLLEQPTPAPTPEEEPAPDPNAAPAPDPNAAPAPDPMATPAPAPDPMATPAPAPDPTAAPDPNAAPVPDPNAAPAPDPNAAPAPEAAPITPTQTVAAELAKVNNVNKIKLVNKILRAAFTPEEIEDEASFYKMLRLFAIKKIGKLSSNSETPKKINK